ncbi:hypothetical protein ACT8ZV_11860 [Nocardioides sp. MAHUQ-72]|uniref:hypothetical protein n=1 Tax=unclassified Nocardioides TaxID=2615069 RepID=UPI0036136782
MSATRASLQTGSPSLSAMAGIEARRVARNPFFLLATLVAFALLLWTVLNASDAEPAGDLLSWPVIPAFFVGLTSLVVLARQTRSTEAAAEAMNAAPGTEARRTLALALACLVPGAVGLLWVLAEVALTTWREPAPQEWWFGTMPDAQVWAMLLANGPVACLGGGLLGVLTGRWLRFPGAAAVAVVVVLVIDMLGQFPSEETSHPAWRLWTPWATFQSGTDADGTAVQYGGNAVFYLVYVLCLCVAAVIAAVWHDRVARTGRLKGLFAGVVVVGLVALALSMTTGTTENRTSDPVPSRIS